MGEIKNIYKILAENPDDTIWKINIYSSYSW
jgi:hypothetical protein